MKRSYSENEMACLTEELLNRCENQIEANKIYVSLLCSYGLVDLSAYDGNDDTFVGKSQLTSADYPDYYGGAYIDHNGKLVVLVTQPVDECKRIIEKIANEENFIVKNCQYSYKELLTIKEKIEKLHNENLDSKIFKNLTIYGVSDRENLVFVELDDFCGERIKLFKEKVVDSPMIVFRHGDRAVAETTVNSGVGIHNHIERSSMGFRANAGGVNGFVMSGHGARTLNTNIALHSNNAALGRVTGFQFSGSIDAAFVQTNSNVTLSNVIAHAGITHSGSVAASAVGTTVFQSGSTTGLTSGIITAVNVSVITTHDFFGSVPLHGLVSATYNSSGGDSGGIVYQNNGSQRPILGIHVASGPVYCTAANIQNAFRVNPF